MNTLVIVLIAAVCLFAAYVLYGRWLAKKWGIDPKAKTPATLHNDGQDYVPTDGWTVFAHQFSSIAGAGPVTGAIQAAAFGWLPVLLWIILGGIFFGAVTDFGALYASVKNDGRSMGLLIEKYIGKTGRKLFLGFCWLFCLIVIAAFADMVADTFNAYVVTDGVQSLSENATVNGAAGSISLFFILFAVVFGVLQHKLKLTGWKEVVFGLVCTVLAFVFGMNFPVILGKDMWVYIAFAYIFLAAVLPMWFVMQPRDYMSTFMFIGMIAGAVLGLVFAHPAMNLPAFTGFQNESLGTLFPILFVTVACGAVSGFHSLVSSGTSSKTVSNEKDMLKVGYGAMVLESLLAVIALCVAGAAAGADGTAAVGTPFQIFSSGVAGFLEMFGIPVYVAQSFMTMCVSALAFTTLDSVARIGRMSFQELFSVDDMEHAEGWRRVLCNKYFSTPDHTGVRLHTDPGGIFQYLAPVRKRQPAAERSCAHHPVRVPEGDRKRAADTGPALCDHACSHFLSPCAEIYLSCPGVYGRNRCLHGGGTAAHRGCPPHDPGSHHRVHLREELIRKKAEK